MTEYRQRLTKILLRVIHPRGVLDILGSKRIDFRGHCLEAQQIAIFFAVSIIQFYYQYLCDQALKFTF